jgi:SagB-type dehydrogenase family enzyme
LIARRVILGVKTVGRAPVFPFTKRAFIAGSNSRIRKRGMSHQILSVLCALLITYLAPVSAQCAESSYPLPKPNLTTKMSVEAAMAAKKSVRSFKPDPLTDAQIGQMLWAANGNIAPDAVSKATTKTIPSAGGLYPLEIFLVVGKGSVGSLPEGIYRYDAGSHALKTVSDGDSRNLLAYACLQQLWMAKAPAIVVITAVFSRITGRYGPRGVQYAFMEAGSASQNLYLQAEALGLHVGAVGAFDDVQVSAVMKLPADTTPLLVIPVGK